jgi:GTP pyrophosphokinase
MIKIKDEYTKLLKEQSPAEVLQVPSKSRNPARALLWKGWTTAWSNLQSAATRAGDDIIGFITRGFGVSIHKRSCSNARAGLLGDDRPAG